MDGSIDVAARTSGRWWQFSLRTAFLGITDVAVLLAFLGWFGKDGLLLAGVMLPLLTVPWFVEGKVLRKGRITVAMSLLTTGVVWSIMFPKTKDLLRPDMLDSVLVGIALLGSGTLLIGMRKGAVLRGLSLAFLCSMLLNCSLLNHLYLAGKFMLEHLETAMASMPAPASGGKGPTPQGKPVSATPAEATQVLPMVGGGKMEEEGDRASNWYGFSFDGPVKIDVRSPDMVDFNGKSLRPLYLHRARFRLDEQHLTCEVTGSCETVGDLKYVIHVAVFSDSKRLLGTATGSVEVSKAVIGQPMALDVNPKFDFGISKTYTDAKYLGFIRLKRAPASRYDVRSMLGRSCGGKGQPVGRELLGKKEWSRDGSVFLF